MKDPSSFAPPPKHAGVYGTERGSSSAGSPTTTSRPAPALPPSRSVYDSRQQQQTSEDDEPITTGPFRADTTGLSTAHLPKPPIRRSDSPGMSSSPQSSIFQPTGTERNPPPPLLPPRLPPRNAVARAVPDTPSSPPPSYTQATIPNTAPEKDLAAGLLNQGAINRLSAAGISVPGFDIGSQSNNTRSLTVVQQDPTPPIRANVSELQSRFAALGSAVSSRAGEGYGPVGTKKQPALPTKPIPTSSKPEIGYRHAPPPPIPLATKPK